MPFPPFGDATEDLHGKMHHHNGASMVTFPGLVSNTDGEPSGAPSAPPKMQRPSKESTQPISSTGGTTASKTSYLQIIGKHHAAAGVSKKASDFLLAGWSKGTNTTYQSGWESEFFGVVNGKWIPFHMESNRF